MTVHVCKKCEGHGVVSNPVDDKVIPCVACCSLGFIDTGYQRIIMLLRDMQKEVIPDAIEYLKNRDYDHFMYEMMKIRSRHHDICEEMEDRLYGERV